MKETWANNLVVRLRIRTLFELIASTLPPHHLRGQRGSTMSFVRRGSGNLCVVVTVLVRVTMAVMAHHDQKQL